MYNGGVGDLSLDFGTLCELFFKLKGSTRNERGGEKRSVVRLLFQGDDDDASRTMLHIVVVRRTCVFVSLPESI